MSKTKVKSKNNIGRFARESKKLLSLAQNRMALDIKQLAKVKMPYKDGGMIDNTYEEKKTNGGYRVVVDTSYAAYQERGARKDGSRPVKNYSTPSTGKNFLKNAGQQVARNAVRYYKQANNLIKLK